MDRTPKFSLVTPVYNPRAADLDAMFASARAQAFREFEHVVVDDASDAPHVAAALRAAASSDHRVRVVRRNQRGGIVAASNEALAHARCEFVAFLDHDDMLHTDALSAVATAIANSDDVDYVYTDEDKIDETGNHYDPFLKPAWSPERFRAQMYTCHLSVVRRALVNELGGFRAGFDGSQDWDLLLRVTEQARRIVHVPRILYHWRATPGSAAAAIEAKPWAYEAARRAVTDHVERVGLEAEVVEIDDIPGTFRLRPRLRSKPQVSIVIPTGGFSRRVYGAEVDLVVNTVRSIVERSTYENIELLVIADDCVSETTREQLDSFGARIVPFTRSFSFSEKINLGALEAQGDYLLLLNDDVEVLPDGWADTWPHLQGTSSWIEAMLMYASQERVGVVGGKLYFSDLRLQHVGVVNVDGGPVHIYRGFRRDHGGYFNNMRIPVNYLALTGACVMTRRDVFERVGGLSPELPINFNDIDYCLKCYAAGYRNVFTPEAELLHFESSSRDAAVQEPEHLLLRRRWETLLQDDPYYNPQFALAKPDFLMPPYLPDGEFALGALRANAPVSR